MKTESGLEKEVLNSIHTSPGALKRAWEWTKRKAVPYVAATAVTGVGVAIGATDAKADGPRKTARKAAARKTLQARTLAEVVKGVKKITYAHETGDGFKLAHTYDHKRGVDANEIRRVKALYTTLGPKVDDELTALLAVSGPTTQKYGVDAVLDYTFKSNPHVEIKHGGRTTVIKVLKGKTIEYSLKQIIDGQVPTSPLYTFFTRCTPQQKKNAWKALKAVAKKYHVDLKARGNGLRYERTRNELWFAAYLGATGGFDVNDFYRPAKTAPQPGPTRPGPRKVEPRRVEPRRVEPRRVEPRKVEPRKVEPRRVEPRKVEPRKVEPRRVEPRKVEPQKVEPRKAPTPIATPAKPKGTRLYAGSGRLVAGGKSNRYMLGGDLMAIIGDPAKETAPRVVAYVGGQYGNGLFLQRRLTESSRELDTKKLEQAMLGFLLHYSKMVNSDLRVDVEAAYQFSSSNPRRFSETTPLTGDLPEGVTRNDGSEQTLSFDSKDVDHAAGLDALIAYKKLLLDFGIGVRHSVFSDDTSEETVDSTTKVTDIEGDNYTQRTTEDITTTSSLEDSLKMQVTQIMFKALAAYAPEKFKVGGGLLGTVSMQKLVHDGSLDWSLDGTVRNEIYVMGQLQTDLTEPVSDSGHDTLNSRSANTTNVTLNPTLFAAYLGKNFTVDGIVALNLKVAGEGKTFDTASPVSAAVFALAKGAKWYGGANVVVDSPEVRGAFPVGYAGNLEDLELTIREQNYADVASVLPPELQSRYFARRLDNLMPNLEGFVIMPGFRKDLVDGETYFVGLVGAGGKVGSHGWKLGGSVSYDNENNSVRALGCVGKGKVSVCAEGGRGQDIAGNGYGFGGATVIIDE